MEDALVLETSEGYSCEFESHHPYLIYFFKLNKGNESAIFVIFSILT